MSTTLQRTTFITNRTLEFFTEKELQMQIGLPRPLWLLALVKELVDNALDACEKAGTPPHLSVSVEPDRVTVQDNGPGLPPETLLRSLDYLVRVSDKSHYVSPTRGQLGNALKCLWAAPFVASGDRGVVEVGTRGEVHRIEVTLDRIAQQPVISHTTAPAVVKNGTRVCLHWPGASSLLLPAAGAHSYNAPDLRSLLCRYALCNPHATLTLTTPQWTEAFPATLGVWRKWTPDTPTCPHWYDLERFRGLIAAYIAGELAGNPVSTVRELVAEFHGLSGTQKQKAVSEAAGLSGPLRQLVVNGDVCAEAVGRLLAEMKRQARPVRAATLGVLGPDHWHTVLARNFGADAETLRYRRVEGEHEGLPFVLEVAFGLLQPELRGAGRILALGVNWSPALNANLRELTQALSTARVDPWDPVVVAVHLVYPRPDWTDRGKTQLSLPAAIADALGQAVCQVTRDWTRAKKDADREERVRDRELEELRKAQLRKTITVKEAAYQVMEAAYRKASADGTLPANARQIMYAARPLIQRLTGKERLWKDSRQFTQGHLVDFLEDHPDLTAGWDVVFDARGRLIEPHTGHRTDLGTLEVRRYLQQWTGQVPNGLSVALDHACPSHGPQNRYRYALFVEKEGFPPLFEAARLADRYDLAIMSTKGMSVTAARRLLDHLSEVGVTVLIARDFDKYGFSIAHTLAHDGRRYRYRHRPRVIDLGLRLTDVEALGLDSEAVEYDSRVDPRANLRERGATEAECDFLVARRSGSGWSGRRVELNAMTSSQLLEWLEAKFAEVGVTKLVPDRTTLAGAYRRSYRYALLQREIDRITSEIRENEISLPPDLGQAVASSIAGTTIPWDEALWTIARTQLTSPDGGAEQEKTADSLPKTRPEAAERLA